MVILVIFEKSIGGKDLGNQEKKWNSNSLHIVYSITVEGPVMSKRQTVFFDWWVLTHCAYFSYIRILSF